MSFSFSIVFIAPKWVRSFRYFSFKNFHSMIFYMVWFWHDTEKNWIFWLFAPKGFTKSLAMTVLSEIGDKTFFAAAVSVSEFFFPLFRSFYFEFSLWDMLFYSVWLKIESLKANWKVGWNCLELLAYGHSLTLLRLCPLIPVSESMMATHKLNCYNCLHLVCSDFGY